MHKRFTLFLRPVALRAGLVAASVMSAAAGLARPEAPEVPFPSDMECVPLVTYRHRPDGKPGREVTITAKGTNLYGKATLTVACEGRTETTRVPAAPGGRATLTALLPAEAFVSREC